MKAFSKIICATLLMACFCACKKKPDDLPHLDVDRTAISMGLFQGFTDSFEVHSNAAWELELSPASANQWISLSTTQGNAGKTIVKITTAAVNATSQTAAISVNQPSGNLPPAELIVTQKVYTPEWNNIYGGSKDDHFQSMAKTSDGGLVIAGYTISDDGDFPVKNGTYEGFVMKMNAAGAIEWAKTYGGTGVDVFSSITVTTDGDLIACGNATTNNNGDVPVNHGNQDVWAIGLDGDNGAVKWKVCYGGAAADKGIAVSATPDGGAVVLAETDSDNTGNVGHNNGETDMWVLKLNDMGELEWNTILGGNYYEYGKNILATADGGCIMLALSQSDNSGNVGDIKGNYDAWVVKLNADGQIVWNKLFGGSDGDELNGIAPTPDNGFVLCGTSSSINSGDVGDIKGENDAWILKIDASGNKKWNKTYGGQYFDVTKSITVTPEGDLLLSGSTESDNSGDIGPVLGANDLWLLKLTSKGGKLWSKTMGGSLSEAGYSIASYENGTFIIGAITRSNSTGDVPAARGASDTWLLKFE